MKKKWNMTFINKNMVNWKIGSEVETLTDTFIVTEINYSDSNGDKFQYVELTNKKVYANG